MIGEFSRASRWTYSCSDEEKTFPRKRTCQQLTIRSHDELRGREVLERSADRLEQRDLLR